jgi:hypothetical protein
VQSAECKVRKKNSFSNFALCTFVIREITTVNCEITAVIYEITVENYEITAAICEITSGIYKITTVISQFYSGISRPRRRFALSVD